MKIKNYYYSLTGTSLSEMGQAENFILFCKNCYLCFEIFFHLIIMLIFEPT